jgi:hypothetical protein
MLKNKYGEPTKEQFRYRHRQKKGVAGKWISRDYVDKAVKALYRFDDLMNIGDLNCLKSAAGIAKMYFTDEARKDVEKKITDLAREKFDRIDRQRLRERRTMRLGMRGRHAEDCVAEAVAALNTYDKLRRKGDWRSLKTAEKLSKEYFTETAHRKEMESIDGILGQMSVLVGEGIRDGRKADPNIAKQAYSHLIRTRDPYKVGLAVEIAENYISREIADRTNVFRNQLLGVETPLKNHYFDERSIGSEDQTGEIRLSDLMKLKNLSQAPNNSNAAPVRGKQVYAA